MGGAEGKKDGRSVKAVSTAECGGLVQRELPGQDSSFAERVSVGLAFSKPTLIRVLKC